MIQPSTLRSPFASIHTTVLTGVVFLFVTGLVLARFYNLMPSFFLGDDLASYWLYKDAQLLDALTTPISEKWRPFPTLVYWLELHLFNFSSSVKPYLAVSILNHSISAVLAFMIFRQLTGGRLFISGLLAGLAAISHFALYQITYATGLVEGPSLTFLLIVFFLLLNPSNLNSKAKIGVLLGASFLLMHTHERYIGVMPWACLLILFSPRFQAIEFKRRAYVSSGLFAIPVCYLAIKAFILKSSFLIGAAGKPIALDYRTIIQLTEEALLSLVGINCGPPYLAGINLLNTSSATYWIPALLIASAGLTILWLGIRNPKDAPAVPGTRWRSFCLDKAILIETLVLGMLILGPPLLTIRLEQRWLVAPYILLLSLVAWSMGRLMPNPRKKALALILFGCFAAATLMMQLLITPHLKANLSFVRIQTYAGIISRDLPKFINSSSKRIGVLGNRAICVAVLGRGKFVQLYFPEPKPEILCGEDIAMFNFEGASAVTRVLGFDRSRTQLLDMTESVKAQKQSARGPK